MFGLLFLNSVLISWVLYFQKQVQIGSHVPIFKLRLLSISSAFKSWIWPQLWDFWWLFCSAACCILWLLVNLVDLKGHTCLCDVCLPCTRASCKCAFIRNGPLCGWHWLLALDPKYFSRSLSLCFRCWFLFWLSLPCF